MTTKTCCFAFILAAFVALLTERVGGQDEEPGTLPPVLKAIDEQGNRDGKIQREELPERLRRFFEITDLNGDGVLTWQEVDEAKASRFADLPKLEDVIGELDPQTLELLGGSQYEVGWSEGKLFDASRKREIAYLIRYPKDREGLTAIVLLSHGGYGNPFGQYAYTDLATTYARLGFLAVNIGHRQSANEIQHRYDRPLDVSFVIDALVRTRAASLRIPGGGSEDSLPMPPDFKGIPDVDHIGHVGHSFGAFTAHAVGGANWSPTMGIRNFRDPRVDAIVPISPQGFHRFGGYDEGPENNSWSDIRIPVYLICGEHESPEWRRQPFDRYPATGDKFFTVAKGWGHNIVNGDEPTKRLLALNSALFFHTYLRDGNSRDTIGTLAWIDGWTLERKLEDGTAIPAVADDSPAED
ncbi:MAG: hypothetical protein ACOY3P_12150 [Planctomycetota bacterium]